ncbi:adenosylmethionine--8-amino-7-oxononanoate transaminase [Clostridium botulinum]|uniref:adenosylmethionine--8-amino-7-oxononanoate transaminase n=1 Tax=Clostridium botulinum TaxID=1491 RepID=UPI0004DAD134|nr:adenosylmethionine--8-amino-7-oxononanoate transaminase [Clostridium botulinum]KEI02304.1 adenosylmethionine-8-amino-7-oxononanoate aminotransferase [Clostridium botulinum D str. 16868]KOC34012.1 adenosylmethionine-8-amino-7-oxononanoate aminotransferase [Clostridium botulinum]NFF60129.1 adenosylmethionine--8-amino-7-oxononanoate transaminase [Clostridium botulinum]NFL01825.1 adenosylmethionine--8-amino-7-oxononanoate transaminase [Clostridium botulinum]
MNDYQSRDLKHIWHPCSQMKDYEHLPPIVIEKGQGAYLYDIDGNKYLDCISSWWCNSLGHANERLNNAIKEQIDKIEHVIFANFTNIPAIELSEKLVKIAPKGLEKIFFNDNGSSSVEAALKMSFHYHQQVGNVKKKKFVAITDAYHGETLGALSVGDLDLYSKIYKPLLLDTFRVEGPDCYRCKYEKCRDNCMAECFEKMQKVIDENHEKICAVIIEPMIQGAAGMKIYSQWYLKKLRKICDKYDIHLIADEIAVGFGRSGKMFACDHAEITPDMMCLSKALTAGYMPMSVVMTTNKIYDAFYDDYNKMKAFMHSHTYAGNAMACAVALESLKILEDDNILEKNKEKAKYFGEQLHEHFCGHKNVGEVRQLSLVAAIELVQDKNKKEGFPWQDRVGYEIYKLALKKGLLLRPLGNVIYFNFPYVVEKEDIQFAVKVAKECMEEYFRLREKKTYDK